MPVLLHLNGPSGIGKSTIARCYVDDHPGVLSCDIDVLRTLIGGWADDFLGTGSLVRPAALGMIEAYLASGHDLVLPQVLTSPDEVALFEACATRVGATFVERLLIDDEESSIARFDRRGGAGHDDEWHTAVRAVVAAQGGDDALRRRHRELLELARRRPRIVEVASIEDDVEATYRLLLASLGEHA